MDECFRRLIADNPALLSITIREIILARLDIEEFEFPPSAGVDSYWRAEDFSDTLTVLGVDHNPKSSRLALKKMTVNVFHQRN